MEGPAHLEPIDVEASTEQSTSDQILRFGDCFSLFTADEPGYLHAPVFGGEFTPVLVNTAAGQSDHKLDSFSLAVFQLHAQCKYKAAKRLRAEFDAYQKRYFEKNPDEEDELTLETALLEPDSGKLAQLKQLADDEQEDNALEQERRARDPVMYGQVVQVFHRDLERYLTVSSTVTTEVEKNNMRIEVDPYTSRHAWFKIMPRFKVRSEGEPVRMGDQIMLESIKTTGQFVHVTSQSLPDTSMTPGSREVNVSVTPTSFTLLPHHRPLRASDVSAESDGTVHLPLRSGDLIQLFHKEVSAYLAAEGYFYTDQLVLDAHLRVREPDARRPHRLEPPTSAVSFWMVEHATTPTMGNIIEWDDVVRFKHSVSGRYLTMNADGSVSLSNVSGEFGFDGDERNFVMTTVIPERREITLNSYTRIKNVVHNHWLHANKDVYLDRPTQAIYADDSLRTPLSERMNSIKWDNAPLMQLAGLPQRRFDDAFIIQGVSRDVCSFVAHVKAMIPIFRFATAQIQGGRPTLLFYQRLTLALEEFVAFLRPNGIHDRRRQKLLRNFGIVELCVELLQAPIAPFHRGPNGRSMKQVKQDAALIRVMEECYELLESYATGNSRKNELYLVRHLSFFHQQMGYNCGSEKMITELIRDNAKIVENISETEVDFYISLLASNGDKDYFDVFGVLCNVEGAADGGNQSLIVQKLLIDRADLLYTTRLDKQANDMVIMVPNRGSYTFTQAWKQRHSNEAMGEIMEFLEKQLDMFSELCYQRCAKAIDCISQNYLDWEQIFWCVQNIKDPDLRRMYVDLMRVLYVDINPNVDVLDGVALLFPYKRLTADPFVDATSDNTRSITGTTMSYFPELSRWIINILSKDKGAISAADDEENEFTEAVLELTRYLVEFGYFISDDDIESLMTPLRRILQGSNDVPSRPEGQRSQTMAPGKKRFRTQSRVPVLPDSYELKCQQFRAEGRFELNPKNKVVIRVKLKALEIVDTLVNLCLNMRLHQFLFDFRQLNEVNEPNRRNTRQTRSGKPLLAREMRSGPTMTLEQMQALKALMDGDIDPTQLTSVVRAYIDEVIDRSNYIAPGWRPQQSRDRQGSNDSDFAEILLDLAKYPSSKLACKALQLMNRVFSAADDLFNKAVDAQLLLDEGSIAFEKELRERIMPDLRRVGGAQIEEGEEAADFCELLDKLVRACDLDARFPHSINQQIIVNNDVLPVIFDTLNAEDQPSEVVAGCFRLLRALSRNNPFVQSEFFDRLDQLLTIENEGDTWQDDMAVAVYEIFADNEKLSLALRPRQIEKLMSYIHTLNFKAPQLLVTTRSIVKCEELDVPLDRNQNLVMKFLMKNYDSVIAPANISVQADPSVVEARMQLLRSKDPAKLGEKQFHAYLVGLIAHCAEGYNRFIESTCMTLLSFEDILAVVADPHIPFWIKSEYVLFFYFVYLETAAQEIETGMGNIASNIRLWTALLDLAKSVLNSAFNSPEPYLAPEVERCVFDAFLPTLTHMVKHHTSKMDERIQAPLRQMHGIIQQLATRAADRLYTKEMAFELSSCLVAFDMSSLGLATSSDLLNRLDRRMQVLQGDVAMSTAYQQYEDRFRAQLHLNEALNKFVKRVREAFGGANLVAVQIPHHTTDSEILARDYCEGEEDDEYLPLGPEFQIFVDMFARYQVVSGVKQLVGIREDDVRSLVRSLMASQRYSAGMDAKDADSQEVLDIRSLQLLRALIHNQIKVDAEVVDIQNDIAGAGAVLPVASLLSHSNDEVVRESLALLVALLDGGNKAAQQSFLQHFLATREETFFYDVNERITRSIESRTERRSLERQLAAARAEEAELQQTMRKTNKGKGHKDVSDAFNPLQSETNTDIVELSVLSHQDSALQMLTVIENRDEPILQDQGNIELVLRVLQFMCEGHFRPIQDYLRLQPDNARKINLVAATVEFLHVLSEDLEADDRLDLVVQTVETCVEFCQGCIGNQKAVFDARVVDDINFILRSPELHNVASDPDVPDAERPIMEEKVAHLYLATANLVLSMLENSDDETAELALEIHDTLDHKRILETMFRYYALMDARGDKNWQTEDDDDPVTASQVAYAMFAVIIRLQDFTKKDYMELTSGTSSFKRLVADPAACFETMRSQVVSIEILRDNQLHRVHFFNRWKSDIRPEIKEHLQQNVDRSSPSDKLQDFVARCKDIIADISYQKRMQEFSFITWFISHYSRWWAHLMLLLTLVLNVIILAVWRAPVSWDDPVPEYSVGWYTDVLGVLGAFHIIFSSLVAIAFFLLHPPSLSALVTDTFGDVETIEDYPSWIAEPLKKLVSDEPGSRNSPISLSSLYHIGLVLFSILGLAYHGYFYCYAFFHIVVGNDILLRVIQAVTKNSKSLLWLAALMVIVIYIYSLVSFAFLRKAFDESEGAFCQTAFQCFITSLRLGLMSGGGLGEALPGETFSFIEPGVRTLFDLSFFIIVTIIGLNLVFGVIVDTFSELRDEAHEIAEARKTECFISGLKADEFERYGNGFKHHINHEQNMWHYLAFFLHLADKPRTEYTSHEQYVADHFEADEITFFPQNRAMCVTRDDEAGVEDRLGSLEAKLAQIMDLLERETEERAASRKRGLQRSVTSADE